MENLFQLNSKLYSVLIFLIPALVIILRSALNMIWKKRIIFFIPFFILGIGLSLTSAFIFYNFFGIAMDIFYTSVFLSIFLMFFILWRFEK